MAVEKREGEMKLYIHLITHARERNTYLLFQHESPPTLPAAVRIKKKDCRLTILTVPVSGQVPVG